MYTTEKYYSMEKRMERELLLLLLFFLPLFIAAMAFADTVDLKNPDFELPPSNIPSNYSTIPLLPLNASINSIPGWYFRGSVAYLSNTSSGGPDGIMYLPAGSGAHAIYLGGDGTINQRLNGTEQPVNYIFTFTILGAAQKNCDFVGNIIISLSQINGTYTYSHSFDQNVFDIGQWETRGVHLGSHGDGLVLDLVLEYHKYDDAPRNPCRGPIVDSLFLNKVADPVTNPENNLLSNGGFEMGPASSNNSLNGVLMSETSNRSRSPLIQWIINGTVKYITSNRNYLVPEGNAAIQLVYGESSGVQSTVILEIGSTYKLEFFIGDANEGCVGKFVVGVQAGSASKNFTVESAGHGLAQQFSMKFQADSSVTFISFVNYKSAQSRNSVECGPVIDDVILLPHSYGLKLELPFMVLFSCMVLLVTIL